VRSSNFGHVAGSGFLDRARRHAHVTHPCGQLGCSWGLPWVQLRLWHAWSRVVPWYGAESDTQPAALQVGCLHV
jgi:hypothetical protein